MYVIMFTEMRNIVKFQITSTGILQLQMIYNNKTQQNFIQDLTLVIQLIMFQWSPDGKLILFGMTNGEVHVYDNSGNFIVSLYIYEVCLSTPLSTQDLNIATV